MAILVALGGAGIGGATGIGANIGWIVGAVVGQLLFPSEGEKNVVEGPRLGDLSVTSSAYGAPRSIGYGTVRMAGNIIWSTGLREQKNTTTAGGEDEGGKGMGGGAGTETEQITYTYFSTFTVAFGEGEADAVTRIWADGKLIFDKRGDTEATRKSGLKFRFYPGSLTQGRDAAHSAEDTAALTPAYRDTVLIVFDDLPLADFGNRVPNITAEIVYNSTVARDYVRSPIQPSFDGTYNDNMFAVDWDRKFAYYGRAGTNSTSELSHITRVNMATQIVDKQLDGTTSLNQVTDGETAFQDEIHVLPDGGIITKTDAGGSNSNPIARLDPYTLKETLRYGTPGASTTMDMDTVTDQASFESIRVFGEGGGSDYLIVRARGAAAQLLVLNSITMSYVWDTNTFGIPFANDHIKGMDAGAQGDGISRCWILNTNDYNTASTDSLSLYELSLNANALYQEIDSKDTVTGLGWGLVSTIAPGTLKSGVTTLSAAGPLIWDASDDTVLIFWVDDADSSEYCTKWDQNTNAVIWTTEALAATPTDSRGWNLSRLRGDTFGYVVTNESVVINTVTGELIENATETAWAVPEDYAGVGAFDSSSESWVAGVSDASFEPFIRYFFKRRSLVDEDLADIVTDLCTRTSLVSADLDVSDLVGQVVPGYYIGRQTTSRKAIEPLAQLFLFDGFESDFVLNFVMRGQASDRTITEDELGIKDTQSGDVFRENRTQEVELPEEYSIIYMDKDNDYTQQTHAAKRIVQPSPSMRSKNKLGFSINGAFSGDFVKRQAEKSLYSAWVERSNYEFRFAWTHLDLDPSDVITIDLDDGTSFEGRIAKLDVGEGYKMDVSVLSERAAQFDASGVTADLGDGVALQTVTDTFFIKTFVIDCPLLRQADADVLRVNFQHYIWQSGFTDGAFRRGRVYFSSDSVTYLPVGTTTKEASWGTTTDALADPTHGVWQTDDTATVNVVMSVGGDDLASVTNAQLLNGANAAMLIKADGEVEVFQFQTVVAETDGSYTLSVLLRGRRGTDTMAHTHLTGESFLYLGNLTGDKIDIALASLDQLAYYKGVGAGQIFENGENISLTSNGRTLMPLAPVNATAQYDGSNNIDLAWERRSRYDFDLRSSDGTADNSEAPLGESTEAYNLEILDGAGGSVLRTDNTLTASVYEYTAANIATDFPGGIGATIYVNIYQVSAEVGRGFYYEHAIDIDPV